MYFHPGDFVCGGGSFYYNAQNKHHSIPSVNTGESMSQDPSVRERSSTVASTCPCSKPGHLRDGTHYRLPVRADHLPH